MSTGLRLSTLGPALGVVAMAVLAGCPAHVPPEEKLPAPPPLQQGRVDEGPIGKVRRPSRLTADPAEEYAPAPSSDGSMLAYVSNHPGNPDIFVRFLPGSGRVGEYPIVSHYAADSDPAWSPNGRQLAFVSKRDDPKGDIYLYSLKTGDAVPDAIRDAILLKFGEALAAPDSGKTPADREQLERVSEFLEKKDPLVHLPDADREDRGPAWSPDGHSLYYAARTPGQPENIWITDLRKSDSKQVTTDGGFDPAPSPDGKLLAYASRATDPNGCIRVRRLDDGKTVDITRGDAIDGFPAWGHDGKSVFFVRYAFDTNGDGKLDINDRPQIWQIPFDEGALEKNGSARAWPVTPAGRYDLFPHVGGGKLFYSSDDGRNPDIYSVPEAGIFPALATGEEELALADALSSEPPLRLLLLDQIAAKRAADSPASQDAAIAAAQLRADRRELSGARAQAKAILADSRVTGARRARTQVLAARVAAIEAERAGPGGTVDRAMARKAAEELDALAGTFVTSGAGTATSPMKAARAEALFEAGNARMTAGDTLAATEDWQRAVKEGDGWPRAEAWLAAAAAYGTMGQADRSVATFVAALKEYPELAIPAERRTAVERARADAVERVTRAVEESGQIRSRPKGISLAQLPDVGIPETYGERAASGVALAAILGSTDPKTNLLDTGAAIGSLRDLASKNRDLPVLPSLARNEIGDLYVRIGDLDSAAQEFGAVAAGDADARQAQRARLSAAKALLIDGRYEDAVKALGPPPPTETPAGAKAILARRARKAYVKTLLAKADEEFRSKDVQLARKSYRAVLAVDAREVRAHRGLIASYAALGEADKAAAIYMDAAAAQPDDALLRYGVGLAWTYRTPEATWLPKAEVELKKAIFLDDSQVFPHQTLGFTFEKEEELLGEKGGFEKAADQYLLALSLNDLHEDFRNEADLLLNVGNAFFGLENYRRAYDAYARREKMDVPFDVPGRELVYRERFAKCAFESNRTAESIERYGTALAFLDKLSDKDLPAKSKAEHRARLLDERALGIDESNDPAAASAAFLDAAKANSIAGNDQNSAKALRNAAIQLFEKGTGESDYGARTISTAGVLVDRGSLDRPALIDALGYLDESLLSVEKKGALLHKTPPKKRHGLFHYDMTFSMSVDSSEAVEGFDTRGEKELIFTFVGRIYDALEDPVRAREYFEKKKALLPTKVADWQKQAVELKTALLENQIGVFALAAGDPAAAWDSIQASYSRSVGNGSIDGAMTNAVDLGLIALQTRDEKQREMALSTLGDALSLLEHTGTPDPERYLARLHSTRAELLLLKLGTMPAPAPSNDPAAAVKAARESFAAQAKLLSDAEKDLIAARGAIEGSIKGFDGMNRDRVHVLRALARIAAITGRKADATRLYAVTIGAASDRGMIGLAAQAKVEAAWFSGDDAALDAALKALEAVPAPILARELDAHGIEGYYRTLAAAPLAKQDAMGALAIVERMRALQLVAASGGVIPTALPGDQGAAGKKVEAKTAALLRAWRSLGDVLGQVPGDSPASRQSPTDEWKNTKASFDAAAKDWSGSVEEWGAWDETAWTLAHPSSFYPDSLTAALPGGGALIDFIIEPDALWTIRCDAGTPCVATSLGAGSSANDAAIRAAAAKALATLPKDGRLELVLDAGLYDTSWVPADVWNSHVVTLHRSAQQVIASYARRAPYRERLDDAATAGAVNFKTAVPRADVLRLDVPGTIPAGNPLRARWELATPDAPPPARQVLGRNVISASPRVALIAADVVKGSDPETLLLLADMWIRAGAGTVLFAPAESSAASDVFAKATALTGAPAGSILSGNPGMTTAELSDFGKEQLDANWDAASAANEDKRWDDGLLALDRATYLIRALGLGKDRLAAILESQAAGAYNAQEYARGVRYATELVAHYEANGESGETYARSLVTLGTLQQRSEQYEAATVTLERAAKRYDELGQKPGKANTLKILGQTQELALSGDKAVAAFQKALAIQEELGSSSGVGDLERKIGRTYYSVFEDYAQAEKHYRAAKDAYAKAKDPSGEDEATLELGLVAERRGALAESKTFYQGVFDRAAARKDERVRAKAELFLANNSWLTAEYQDAFTHTRNVRHSAEALGDKRLAFLSRSTEGLVQWMLNDFPRSRALQTEALEMAKKFPTRIDEASTWNNIGIVERDAGEYEKAIEAMQQALVIDKKLGSKWGQAYDLRNIGQTWIKAGDPGKASEPLEEAVQLSASIGDKVNGTKALLALAELHKIQGDTEKSRALYQRALEGSLSVHLPEVTWRAHQGLAEINLARGDVEKARSELDEAIRVVEDLRAAIRVEELKNGFITNKLSLYDDAIKLALDHPQPGTDKAVVSWGYSERSRARSFIDLLANRRITLATPEDGKRIDDQRALKDRLFAAEDALAKAPAAEKDARKAELGALREQYKDLLVEIRAASPKLSAFVTVDPPTLEDVRKVLGKDTAIVEYHVAANETIVWTITDSAISVVRLPVTRAQLEKSVTALNADLEAVRPVDEKERALGKMLLEPALGPAAGKHYLGIVPHGRLHYLSFAAVKTGNDYLVDRFSLFYTPSAAILPLTLSQGAVAAAHDKSDSRVLAIGNPDLGDPSFALPFADLEVSDMKLDFPQIDILTHERATDRWVAKNIGSYRVIHFACHGEFDPVNPLFSAIRLAHEQGAGSDGALTAHEIFGIPMKAELVTLSACQTGLGKIEGGDEIVGLNRAFLYAGTRSVMSTLWRVHDGSTAVLVKHFYRNYARESKADALRDSMRTVREYYPHPAYWAAFALTGEYR